MSQGPTSLWRNPVATGLWGFRSDKTSLGCIQELRSPQCRSGGKVIGMGKLPEKNQLHLNHNSEASYLHPYSSILEPIGVLPLSELLEPPSLTFLCCCPGQVLTLSHLDSFNNLHGAPLESADPSSMWQPVGFFKHTPASSNCPLKTH